MSYPQRNASLAATGGGSYIDVFEIPVRRGCTFDDCDDGSAEPAVVINEAFASEWQDLSLDMLLTLAARARLNAELKLAQSGQ